MNHLFLSVRMPRLLWVVLVMVGLAGCSTKPPVNQFASEQQGNASQVDPWPTAAATLRKQPNLGGARQVVSQLTADLANNPQAQGPAELAPETLALMTTTLRLTPEETKQLTSTAYTNLDAAYLAECLLIRDAVRSLDLGNLPLDRKAAYGFDWVCRQIYLRNGTIPLPGGQIAYTPALPPQYALLRGHGSGLERAYVFLSVLRQLGLDGCLIGPPNQEQASSLQIVGDKPGKGPFWAVGARLPDGNVLLFDPWRGQPFPGSGSSIGTLAQVMANPDSLKPWFEDKANPWDVKPADLKEATVYTVFRLGAISNRMKLLEQKIESEVGVKLYNDMTTTLERRGATASVWAPSDQQDHHCYTRVLESFLPIEEGGTDVTTAKDGRLFDYITKAVQIPFEMFTPPPQLTAVDVRNALRNLFVTKFAERVAELVPQDKIQRGQLNEAIRTLIASEQALDQVRQQTRSLAVSPDDLAKWAQKANELYQELSLARLPQNQGNLPNAEAAVQQFWAQKGIVPLYLESSLIIPICQAELSYWIAVCKHEQAERSGIRLQRTEAGAKNRPELEKAAQEAWAVAKDAWDRYLTAGEPYLAVVPQRTAHVRKLAERAGRLAANPTAFPNS